VALGVQLAHLRRGGMAEVRVQDSGFGM
jgi:hypothetical protein